MFDNYTIITGDQLNSLLDSGYTIAGDGALLPPDTIEQEPEPPMAENEVSIVDLMQAWADGYGIDGEAR